MKFYLTFSEYKAFLKNREKPVPTWRIVLYYPFVWLFMLMILLAIKRVLTTLSSNGNRKYPSDKYKRVVKEGLFWDTVEYHER